MFTWIPIHKEGVSKILSLPDPPADLLAVLKEMEQKGLTEHAWKVPPPFCCHAFLNTIRKTTRV